MDKSTQQLLKTNPRFRRLFDDHRKFEEKLSAFNSIKGPTAQDETERKRIQKLKLQKKDEMEKFFLKIAGKK